MKTCCHKSLGILIVRLLVGGLFLYAGIMKIPMAAEMAPFVGGAAHAIGLTFLSLAAWFWIVVVAEILAGALLILGLMTRFASLLIVIIMLVAMNSMGRVWMQIQIPFMMLVLAVALFTSGPGKYSLSKLVNCNLWVCGVCDGACAMPTQTKMAAPKTAPKKIVFKKKK